MVAPKMQSPIRDNICYQAYTLTHCMAALLRKVDSVRHKELGRRTGSKEEVGNKKMLQSLGKIDLAKSVARN